MNKDTFSAMNMNEQTFRLHSIGNGVEIFTSAAHGFGTDAVLLADFAAPKKSDIACDLGSGCGIIPFLWARYASPSRITALELQPEAVALIQKSIEHNALTSEIIPVCGDLRRLETLGIQSESFSLVTMNPPYFAAGSGYRNEETAVRIARHEETCTPEDVLKAASKLLKYGGRLCLCAKPERLADIICAMRAYAIEPKRLRFVCGKEGKAPYLFLIEGRKGGGKELKILPELHVQLADGTWSEEMKKIYGDYGDGTKQ